MSLVREEHPCWVATCDFCGEGDNPEWSGSFHYATEAEAREELESADWRQLPDGRWQCFSCYEEGEDG